MSVILESVFSLFLIILVGVYGSKKRIITEKTNKGLVEVLIQIALPCMILSSFIFKYDSTIKSNLFKTFYYSLLAYLIMAILSFLILLPIKNDKKTILHFANIFTNTGYVGFPILNSIYGAEGVIYGSIFNMFFVIFVWTYGLMLFNGKLEKQDLKADFKKTLLNPSIIAVFLGIIIMLFEIQIAGAILSSIRSIGNMTGPLSMIIIGYILSNVQLKNHLRDWTIYYGIIIKLLVIPLLIYCLTMFIGDSSKAVNTVIIMTAMPASAMTAIFAESFDKEKEYAAVIVSLTSLLSLITVPLLLKIIM